jgi:transaldolase
MKIFIDTADVAEIREGNDMGIVDGVTTNPSLVAKTGREFREVIDEIVTIVDGPISAEVIATDTKGMIREAKIVREIHPNIVCKIPMTVDGIKAVKVLEGEGTRCNVTLVFSILQAIMAAKAGASYVSPFVGRLDDISQNGMELIGQMVQVYQNYGYKSEIIVASVRNPLHVIESALMGADIVTLPLKVIKQMAAHPLTDKGLAAFIADWEKMGGKIE